MTPREITESFEKDFISEYGCLSVNSKGRKEPVEKCPMRTEFQRDRDKIIHCNSFRRLKHKTQVFLIPLGDHYRTRLTHTLEVSQIARTISKALRLNEDLTEAIALAHDLGHTPFGHAGERTLRQLCPDGFNHYEQSLRVVDYIEKSLKGLNLTYEVRDGIVSHTNAVAKTKEGYVVRLADVIAYINHDIEDAIRAGVINTDSLPEFAVKTLGKTKTERITTLVTSIINNGAKELRMDEDVEKAHKQLHEFMFSEVYTNPICKSEEVKAQAMIEKLYNYFLNNFDKLPADYMKLGDMFSKERAICDYIAGMTDTFAINTFSDLFIPKAWTVQ